MRRLKGSCLQTLGARLVNRSPRQILLPTRASQCRHFRFQPPQQQYRQFGGVQPRGQSSSSLDVQAATIYALSTAPGRAAIAIVRVSGAACIEVYRLLCPGKPFPKPRFAAFRSIYKPSAPPEIIDSGSLVLFFPGPSTATGEDLLEFHIHGGPAITKALLSAIGDCNSPTRSVRYAEPGEFTRRAFLNGRLDLTQVEALGETLSAVTEEQRRLSVQSTGKGLSARYESWRQLLLYARGELEALIDFSEDQHFDESPFELATSVAVQIRSLANRLTYYSENAVRGELLRNGITVSLVGAPNVGKSSLLNLIIGRNAAIVSKEAGTTRDIVEVGIDLGGYFCRFGDTAGLRQSFPVPIGTDTLSKQTMASIVGEIEQEGIRRTKERAQQSDLVIVVFSVEPSIDGQGAQLSLDEEVIQTTQSLKTAGKSIVAIVNKMDNYGDRAASMQPKVTHAIQEILPDVASTNVFCISCKDANNSYQIGDQHHHSLNDASKTADFSDGNLQGLLNGLQTMFRSMTSAQIPEEEWSMRDFPDQSDASIWQESLGATQRQRTLVDECEMHLREFIAMVDNAQPGNNVVPQDRQSDLAESAEATFDVVVAAESLRAAGRCLERILGRGEAGDVEEVLGVVFEKFCVGK